MEAFPRYWPFMRGIHRSPVRRHRAHYDVIVMWWNYGHHVRLLRYFSIQLQDYGLYFTISISQWYYQNFPHAQGCSLPCTIYVFNVISVFNCRIMVYVFYLDFSMVLPKFPPCPMLLIPLCDVCLLRYFSIQLQDYGLCFLSWFLNGTTNFLRPDDAYRRHWTMSSLV